LAVKSTWRAKRAVEDGGPHGVTTTGLPGADHVRGDLRLGQRSISRWRFFAA
jgi:hypothetical protein